MDMDTQGTSEDREIALSTSSLKWSFIVDEKDCLRQVGFGLNSQPNINAYPTGGNGWMMEPAIRAVHASGDVSTELNFLQSEAKKVDENVTETRIWLKDPKHFFNVTLCFAAYHAEDVIEQWVEIHHDEPGVVRLTHFASSSLSLSGSDFFLTQFHGDHDREANLEEERLTMGIKVLDTKLGVRAHQFRSPSFLLSLGAPLNEDAGEVIAGSLQWPGSFQFSFDRHPLFEHGGDSWLYVKGGMNPYGSDYFLNPGETFVTPKMVWGYSANGAAELSNKFHRWARKYRLLGGDNVGPVQLITWESFYFSFDEPKLHALFDRAKDLGIELFTLDDGWFGTKYPRNDDTQGLGDWAPNPAKLPHGVEQLAQDCIARGMKFGIWVEPEMVNPRSELYEKHPDWVIRNEDRELLFHRNQLILDLSNPEVEEFVFRVVDDLLAGALSVSYIKWDANRFIMQPGSFHLPKDRQSHLVIEYNRAFLRILDRLVANHPGVQWMVCSGGGGRVDFATLSHGHELWPSDNTRANDRLKIQWGYSYLYPAKSVVSNVTHSPGRPLKYTIDVALGIRFGWDVDFTKFTAEEIEIARLGNVTAKHIREVVHLGNQFRLESPNGGSRVALNYVSADKNRAIAFIYAMDNSEAGPVRLKGIDPLATYQITEMNLLPGATGVLPGNIQGVKGSVLLDDGLELPALEKFQSAILELVRVE